MIGMNMQCGMMPGMMGGILQQAMMMAGGMGSVGGGMGMPQAGMFAGMGMGDMTSFSPDAMMGGQSNFFHPLMSGGFPGMGGMGAGMGNGMGMVPGMCMPPGGMGGMNGMNPAQMMKMMMMLMMMMKMMQQMMGGQKGGQGGCPGMGGGMGGPGGMGGCGGGMPMMGGGMPMMGGVGMCGGMSPMQQQGGGGVVEIGKGESFTTPGGCQISWKGDTVNVKEPGGQQSQLGGAMAGSGMAAGQGMMAFAGVFAGNGQAGAFMGAMVGVGGAGGAGAAMMAGNQGTTKPNNWKVWGDPHINDGAGKQQDFKTNNAMFNLKDGTRVAMCAAGPKGVVERVRIFLPGTQVNKQTLGGIDPKQTTVYQNQGLEKKAAGTLNNYMGVQGMGLSPFGNMMF